MERAEAAGLSPARVAEIIGKGRDVVSKMRSSTRKIKADEAYLLEGALAELALRAQPAGEPIAMPEQLSTPGYWSEDVPILGTALGGFIDLSSNGDIIRVEETVIEVGHVIGHVKRPPSVPKGRHYALYVVGDSMEPRFESGDLLIVDPNRPPAIMDYVVVQLAPDKVEADTAGQDAVKSSLVKRLVRRTADHIFLEQFNPRVTFKIAREQVAHIHRVSPMSEILGG